MGLYSQGWFALLNEVSTRNLADYAVGRVGTLAKALKREQERQYFWGRDEQDFALARR